MNVYEIEIPFYCGMWVDAPYLGSKSGLILRISLMTTAFVVVQYAEILPLNIVSLMAGAAFFVVQLRVSEVVLPFVLRRPSENDEGEDWWVVPKTA